MMTAKEYLQQVKAKDAEIKNLKQSIEQLHETLISVGGISYGDKVQTSRNNDKFGTVFSRIDEKQAELEDKIMDCIDFRLKVSSEINALSDARYMEVLHKRYLENKCWSEIACDMGFSDASGLGRYAQIIHGKALIAFEEKYADMLAECEVVI